MHWNDFNPFAFLREFPNQSELILERTISLWYVWRGEITDCDNEFLFLGDPIRLLSKQSDPRGLTREDLDGYDPVSYENIDVNILAAKKNSGSPFVKIQIAEKYFWIPSKKVRLYNDVR